MQELPLYFFTLLTQLSVGIVLFVALWASFVKGVPAADVSGGAIRAGTRALGVAVVACAAALVASLLHLGDMTRAANVLSGLGHSWLSREVVMASVFFVLTVASFVCSRRMRGSLPLVWVTTVIGMGLAVVEGIAYAVTEVPAWGTPSTVLSFLAAVLVFSATAGPLLLRSGIRQAGSGAGVRCALIAPAAAALVVLIAALVAEGFFFEGLQAGVGAARIAGVAFSQNTVLWGVYALASLTGTALVAATGFKLKGLFGADTLSVLLTAAFVLGTLGLFAGRAVFYLVGVPMGIGL